MQINCYATTYSEALTLADAMGTALEAWNTTANPRIDRAYVVNRLDQFEDILQNGEIGIVDIPMDFYIWYNE